MPQTPPPSAPFSSLSIGDIEAVFDVAMSGSVSGTARSRHVTPSQISKALARAEAEIGVRLFARSARGLRLTDAGSTLLPRFVEIVTLVRGLRALPNASERTLVAAAFLSDFFLPVIATALPEARLHSLEMQPGAPSAFAGQPLFDFALTTGSERWPASWSPLRVGSVRRALFASPRLAAQLGRRASADALREVPFIGPVYRDGAVTVLGDDGCPLPARQRRFGYRTQTVALALEMATRVDQLVFAPEIAAHRFIEAKQLVEITVERWSVRDPLFLVCHHERVKAREQRAIAQAMRAALHALP